MLQRIQTLWLLLAIVCTVLTFVIPYAHQSGVAIETSSVLIHPIFVQSHWITLSITISLCCIIPYAILLFKNRKFQILVCIISLIIAASLIIAEYIMGHKLLEGKTLYFGLGFPVLSCIFLLAAIVGIRADERLIKSADRLR